jgi:hypothetical protein
MQGKPEWIPVTEFFQEGFAGFLQSGMEAAGDAKDLYVSSIDRLKGSTRSGTTCTTSVP